MDQSNPKKNKQQEASIIEDIIQMMGESSQAAESEAVDMNDCSSNCHSDAERKSHHSESTKKNLITRLNRVEGQIRGIKGLIEKDTYCDDVITQIAATQAALNSVAKLLLEGHLRSCVVERIHAGDSEIIDELLTTIQRLMKK